MISLADLRARSVAPTWQEAVAVVQELVQTVIASGGALDRLPDLEHVALIPNGDVVVLPGGPIPEQPVRHLGTMLAALLEGANAPGELTAFVEGSLAWPPQFETPEEFSKQLAFFERPGRQQDVERLVSRALASEAQTRTDEELRRLKERTAEAAERSALDETVMMERPRQRSRLPVAIAAAIAVVGIAGAVLYRASIARHERQAAAQAQAAAGTLSRAGGQTPGEGRSTSAGQTRSGGQAQGGGQTPGAGQPPASTPGAAPQTEPPSLVARAAGAFRSAVAAVLGSSTTEKPPAEPVAATGADAPKSKAKPKPHHPAPAPALAAPAAKPPAPEVAARSEPMSGEAPSSVASVTTTRETIYSSADAAVVPPVMVRPVLPAVPPPGLSPDQVGTLDLVIDETGRVSQVKLSSPTNRYQDRMLVAHAKSWVFTPALLDGQPVKYRTRVRVTI